MHNRNLRNKPSETLIKCMEEAIDLQLYLVQEKGPLCLTFQDNNKKKFQISIGNKITCSCGGGKTEHCVHTLFTLNKFFKIPFNHPFMLHLTFSDAELNQLLEKKNSKPKDAINRTKSKELKVKIQNEQAQTNQMSLMEDSICSICQEDMYSAEGLYFCSNSCGHNYHINCLRIFIQHKRDKGDVAKCPMCRAKWNEEEFNKVISSAQIIKCNKRHKGINCSGCSRANIKFERFHCLHCPNYDLCSECFNLEVHKSQAHKFIVKKNVDEKWYGCDYSESNNQRYVMRNIYLNQYLSDCLFNENSVNKQINDDILNEEEGEDEVEEGGVKEENKKEKEKKCSVCKMTTKGNSTLEFMMFKVFPCGHLIHGKCCEKVFKIISFENNNIIVDRNFNKCKERNQTEPIFPGLESINYKIEAFEAKQNHPNQQNQIQQNDVIMSLYPQGKVRMQKPTPNIKRQMIQNILNTPNQYDNQSNSLNFAFNIQKINFSNNNDIHNYENNQFNHHFKPKSVKPGSSNNKSKSKVPFKPIQNNKIKKSETIMARNKQSDIINNLSEINNDNILSIQGLKMNGRPARCENENKVFLSPLLVDIPLNDELI